MANDHNNPENITPQVKPLLAPGMLEKVLNEIIFPAAINEAKKAAGINVHDKQVSSKPFGRAMYALRDVWQGIWWTIPALFLSIGLITILLAVLKKVLGV